MALGDTLGVENMQKVGKLTDAQIAMDDTALEADLDAIYAAALADRSLVIKSGESLYKAYNRTLRKYVLDAPTEAA